MILNEQYGKCPVKRGASEMSCYLLTYIHLFDMLKERVVFISSSKV